jgi:hypothetical protein
MRWAHLPVTGGIYEQNPDFVDGIKYMFSKRGEIEERKQQQRDREQRNPKSRRRR